MTFKKWLIEKNACQEAIEWIGDKTLQEAWLECQCSNWMIWLLAIQMEKSNWPSYQQIMLFISDILKEEGITISTDEIHNLENTCYSKRMVICWLFDLITLEWEPDPYLNIKTTPDSIRSYFQIPEVL
jgi:hypothetical protein